MNKPMTGVILTFAVAGAALTASAATAYFKADFSTGSLPKTMTARNLDESTVDASLYRRGVSDAGWKVENAGSKGFAAVSPTCGGPQLNVLASPLFEVTDAEAVLRWSARSMLPGFRDAYSVVAVDADGKESTLFATDGEEDWWTTRAISLARFEGSSISVEWRCVTDEGGYMLAVDDIFAGLPDSAMLILSDHTLRFQAFDSALATFDITNASSDILISAIQLMEGGDVVAESETDPHWPTGETRSFNLPLPAELDVRAEYSVAALQPDGSRILLGDGAVWCSHFQRTHLLDVGSGLWCNNCPDGHLLLEKAERLYGPQVAPVETHVDDYVSFPRGYYWNQLQFYAAPYYMLNRNHSTATKTGNDKTLLTALEKWEEPTLAEITVEKVETAGSMASISLSTRVAREMENVTVGYVVTRDVDGRIDRLPAMQENAATLSSKEQYYFLPSKIPAKLLSYHNVNAGIVYDGDPVEDYSYLAPGLAAFEGVEGSLPASLIPGEVYTTQLSIAMPASVTDLDRSRIVALLIDKNSGEVLNTALAQLGKNTSANAVATDSPLSISMTGTMLEIGLDASGADYLVEVFAPDGRLAARAEGPAAESVRIEIPGPGLFIVRASQGAVAAAAKFIAR